MEAGAERKQAHTGFILALACIAQFMVILDVSVVNVALPSIGRELHYSPTGLQWVVNAYVLTFAGFLLLGGRAADLYGRRRVFLFGLILFCAASLVGGFAQNAAWLTAARAVQGVGGAVLSPATLTILVTTFTGKELARALGLWSAMGGAGGAVGVVLGGILTAELSWRWVLFINVPIGAIAFVAALAYLTESRRPDAEQRLDVLGAITVTAGLFALIFAIVGTATYPWTSARTLSILAVAAVLLGAFAWIELRVAHSPLVPFSLFKLRSVSGANLVMLLVGAAFFSMWYFLTLYLQNVLGYSPLRAGLSFVPMTIAIIIGAQAGARLLTRVGARPLLLCGTVMATAAFIWLSRITQGSGYWDVVFGGGTLAALALGLMFTPLASAATAEVPQHEAGLASGVLNTSRQVGGSIGLAALATIASSHTRTLLETTNTTQAAALAAGYGRAFEVGAVLAAIGFVAAFVVPRTPRAAGAPVASRTETGLATLGAEPA